MIEEARKAFPDISSVQNLVILYRPDNVVLNKRTWVELDPSAYSAVPDNAVLYINVQLPVTKKYILPLPHQDPNSVLEPQVVHNIGKSVIGNVLPSGKTQAQGPNSTKVSRTSSRALSESQTGGDLVLTQAARLGGDAFGSGWGVASARFRQSAKLIPNLKDCKEAVGCAVGESNGYPESDGEQHANDEKFRDAPQPFFAASYQNKAGELSGCRIAKQKGCQGPSPGAYGGSQVDERSWGNPSPPGHEAARAKATSPYRSVEYSHWDENGNLLEEKYRNKYKTVKAWNGPHGTETRHCSQSIRSTADHQVHTLADGSINLIESDHRGYPRYYQRNIPAGGFRGPGFPRQPKQESARHSVDA